MLTVFPSFLLMSIDAPPSFHTEKYTAAACCFRSNRDTECYLEIFQMVTLSVKLHNWIPSLSIEKP